MYSLSRKKIALAVATALSVAAVALAQYHGVGELDCEPLVEAGTSTTLNLTATGPNTGTVTISSLPFGVVNWSGTPSWDSNNQANVSVSVASGYSGLVYITAEANGQSASAASSVSLVLDL